MMKMLNSTNLSDEYFFLIASQVTMIRPNMSASMLPDVFYNFVEKSTVALADNYFVALVL